MQFRCCVGTDVNRRWSQLTEETMGLVGVPVMTKNSFIRIERDVGRWWKQELRESMAEAG